uniref:Transmembrane protein 14C n=1 Tax=Microcebus murinus TaxID=30608 RepID=A0A8C6EJX7_MICMU
MKPVSDVITQACVCFPLGSVPSLAAGLLFGGLAGLGAYQLSQDPRNIWVFLATSGTLAGIMGMRFYHSGKFMPAGLIAGASLEFSLLPKMLYTKTCLLKCNN